MTINRRKFRIIRYKYLSHAYLLGIFFCLVIFYFVSHPTQFTNLISPLAGGLIPLTKEENSYEVFGFAPHWTLHKLDNVDFDVLTTLAYFGVPVNADGSLNTDDIGYTKFHSEQATEVFQKAHENNTRVVLTLTIMDNPTIESFLDNPDAQGKTIDESVKLVNARGIDGINVDVEYLGDPGSDRRVAFTSFVKKLTEKMHGENPKSRVTVSVYAASAKYPKLYDIGELSNASDGIFMMAYDFATTSSEKAMPTAPLYGHKEGEYWYDISTAVDDFLKQMPSDKLILGLPWYGYDYPVKTPSVNADTDQGYSYWYKSYINAYKFVWRKAHYEPEKFVQTYTEGVENDAELSGWDDKGKVSWKAYKDGDSWRMFFLEDEKSLGIKYDFAKNKNLGGVGIWALGFDEGKKDMWTILAQKFGAKLAKL